jgi:DNA-binding transcriptional ArsR family regulator
VDDPSHARLIKAFTHPLRAAILGRLDQEVLSPKDLARELGAPLSVVSYHVQELARLDLIELVRTQQRRGAVQHWYRSKMRGLIRRLEFETDEQGYAELAATLKETVERLDRIHSEAAQRLEAGAVQSRRATVSVMMVEGAG